MATATRIYHVNVEGEQYLVRASHPNLALMHVARRVSAVRVASQDDLVNCLADGIKVESAAEEAAAAPAAPDIRPESLPLWPMPTPAGAAQEAANAHAAAFPLVEDDDVSRPAQDGQVAGGVPQRQRIPARYRCPMTGSTWSGRGLKPTWLRIALDSGKPLSDFLVIEPSSAAA